VADSSKRSANATADELYANIKYEIGRTVRNWAHVAAASNSRRAIKATFDRAPVTNRSLPVPASSTVVSPQGDGDPVAN